jgi:hypothetical protein
VRTVKTRSGAIAVHIVWSSRRGSRRIEHLGSAHNESELEALKAAGRQRLAEGQGAFDLGLDSTEITGSPLEIVGSRARHPTQTSSRASAGTRPPCSAARRRLTLSPGSVLQPHHLRHSVAATSTRCRCGRVIVPCSEKAGYGTGGHGQRSASEARVPW